MKTFSNSRRYNDDSRYHNDRSYRYDDSRSFRDDRSYNRGYRGGARGGGDDLDETRYSEKQRRHHNNSRPVSRAGSVFDERDYRGDRRDPGYDYARDYLMRHQFNPYAGYPPHMMPVMPPPQQQQTASLPLKEVLDKYEKKWRDCVANPAAYSALKSAKPELHQKLTNFYQTYGAQLGLPAMPDVEAKATMKKAPISRGAESSRAKKVEDGNADDGDSMARPTPAMLELMKIKEGNPTPAMLRLMAKREAILEITRQYEDLKRTKEETKAAVENSRDKAEIE